MTEDDFAAALLSASGRHFNTELSNWVHSKTELPLKELLERHGLSVFEEPAQLAQRLGLRVTESQGVVIKTVLRGGAAESAGFAPGDEWLGIEAAKTGWRMSKLDDLLLYAGHKNKLQALVARDKRLLRLPLTLPTAVTTWRLAIQDTNRVNQWLNPTA
jgi:predicted metalloprotease with PDZ domain